MAVLMPSLIFSHTFNHITSTKRYLNASNHFTGYAANMAVLTALTSMGGKHVAIFSDELNHASIIDGARLACRGKGGASLHVYRHNDMAHLEQVGCVSCWSVSVHESTCVCT